MPGVQRQESQLQPKSTVREAFGLVEKPDDRFARLSGGRARGTTVLLVTHVMVEAQGCATPIAQELFVSEATVKTHLVHVYEKLGVSDRAAAVAVAYDRGILGSGHDR